MLLKCIALLLLWLFLVYSFSRPCSYRREECDSRSVTRCETKIQKAISKLVFWGQMINVHPYDWTETGLRISKIGQPHKLLLLKVRWKINQFSTLKSMMQVFSTIVTECIYTPLISIPIMQTACNSKLETCPLLYNLGH